MAESEKNYCGVERTLIVFKPDAVQRGIVGEILQRFERVGLKIVGVKMTSPSRDHYYAHYEDIGKLATRRGEGTLNITLDMMMDGPVIAMVLVLKLLLLLGRLLVQQSLSQLTWEQFAVITHTLVLAMQMSVKREFQI